MKKSLLLTAALFSLGVSSQTQAQDYFVDYSFATGLGATSATNFGDNLVPRAYPSTSSNPTLSVSGGQLTLGTQASSQSFGDNKIVGVRPQFVNFNDPSRDLYETAMAAAFLPWVEVSLDRTSMQYETSQFFLWGNGAPANFGIGIRNDGSWNVYSVNGYKAQGTATDGSLLRMQINSSGLMEFLIDGDLVHTSTDTYSSLSNAVSGSLTMELRTAGLQQFDAVRINNFSFGSNYSTVPEPASLALIGAGLVGIVMARRRRLI